MPGLGEAFAFLVGRRRRQNAELAESTDARVRVAQEVMEETVASLHAEMHLMRQAHQAEMEECRALYIEMAQALRDCDRERVHLMIRLGEQDQ